MVSATSLTSRDAHHAQSMLRKAVGRLAMPLVVMATVGGLIMSVNLPN